MEREIGYVEQQLGPGAGATSEMIIQTPVDDGGSASVLTSEALLAHLRILKAATRVVVEKDDTAWKLQDLCYAQTIPMSELQVLDSVSHWLQSTSHDDSFLSLSFPTPN